MAQTQGDIWHTLEEVRPRPGVPVVLTIGTFDGVHRAHQLLLAEAVSRARQIGGMACALTFRNHPREVLAPASAPPRLMRWADKRDTMLAAGLDALCGLEFTAELAAMEAERFVREVIVGRFAARIVLSGPNFNFGHRATGGPTLLTRLGAVLGFEYWCADPLLDADVPVSSSRIRESLRRGSVERAAALLGRPHRTHGTVVTGDALGRTIGFPTANLEDGGGLLHPADGVYAVAVRIGDDPAPLPGMMNLGYRPTVRGIDHRREVHLIGFDGELVGKTLAVDYIARLRDERRFASLDDLREQLSNDRKAALAALETVCLPPSSS